MIAEIFALLCGIAAAIIAAMSLYAVAGWPGVGLLVAAFLFGLTVVVGNRPDKPL